MVVERTRHGEAMKPGRDIWWHELMAKASPKCAPAKLDSEHPLFILYTSGTTGKPKGILHTTGGYLTHVTTTYRAIFDMKEDDVYWCTADIGWVTGHSYVVYGTARERRDHVDVRGRARPIRVPTAGGRMIEK